MRLLMTAVAVVCVASGCAVGANSPNAGREDNSRVAGVVKLPEQLAGEQPCDRISVVAMNGTDQVGRSTVRQSRDRCRFEITNLPANQELALQVKIDGLQCANGSELSASAASLTLQDGEIRTQDLKANCG